jgi:4-amino-4-deoxychorismate mutase
MDDRLNQLRREIDALDDGLLDLLARRRGLIERVAAYKHEVGLAVRLPERIEAVKQRCAAEGERRGLDPDFVRHLWSVIIEEACRLEEALLAEHG